MPPFLGIIHTLTHRDFDKMEGVITWFFEQKLFALAGFGLGVLATYSLMKRLHNDKLKPLNDSIEYMRKQVLHLTEKLEASGKIYREELEKSEKRCDARLEDLEDRRHKEITMMEDRHHESFVNFKHLLESSERRIMAVLNIVIKNEKNND